MFQLQLLLHFLILSILALACSVKPTGTYYQNAEGEAQFEEKAEIGDLNDSDALVDLENENMDDDENNVGKDDNEDVDLAQPLEPGQPSMYLLTKRMIANTLKVLDNKIKTNEILQIDEYRFETNIDSYIANQSTMTHFEDYFDASISLVNKIFGNQGVEPFKSCQPSSADDACILDSLNAFANVLYGRALDSEEISSSKTIITKNGADKLKEGLQYAVVRLLNSPNFLYQVFYGEGGKLTKDEAFIKGSLFLTRALPSEKMKNDVYDVSNSADEILTNYLDFIKTNKVAQANLFSNFINEAWGIYGIDTSATAGVFQESLKNLKTPLLKEFNSVAKHIITEDNGDLTKIYTGDYTYANSMLAGHYGIQGTFDNEFKLVENLENSLGLITKGALMATISGGKYANPVHRGMFIQIDLLCSSLSRIDPPANVAELAELEGIDLEDDKISVYDRVQKIANSKSCGACHSNFDPQGLALNNFGNFGEFLTEREGHTIKSDTVIDGKEVKNLVEFRQFLLDSSASINKCLNNSLVKYASGFDSNPNRLSKPDKEIKTFEDLLVKYFTKDGFLEVKN